MGNGAKAQQKRERNAKDAGGAAKSQLKSVRLCYLRKRNGQRHSRTPVLTSLLSLQNAAAKTIICKICRQDWQSTQKRAGLEEHAQNKHSKTYDECFA